MTVDDAMVKRLHAKAWELDLPLTTEECTELLTAALSDPERVVVPAWQPIETAPHATPVLLGYWYRGEWVCEVGPATTGWQRHGVSTMSAHGQAAWWQPLPTPPLASAKEGGA